MLTKLTSPLLVAAQFVLLAALLVPLTPLAPRPAALALLALSVALGVWTLVHNRPGNFNIRPEPKAAGRLITSGPYRYMRHPMYTALLLFAAAVALGYADGRKLPAWIALAAVLWAKARLEERALRQRYQEYAAYAQKVRRFIPGVF